jgi:predicted O-linked N-acetylglucosamine transferase (SPINDLY family)
MEILAAVPNSRLLMSIPAGSCREKISRRLEARGISPDRVESREKKEAWTQFLRSYHQVDIALDPFPHCGWTTSCDALWMGVPVVSLSGRTAMGRGGGTILYSLGLPELVAGTPQQYVETAVALARDLPRLTALRSSLRERIGQSPLRDAKGLIGNIENAYRQMWKTWCAARVRP